ncbi:TPA: hypothetical protein MDR45_005308 [Klebsiella variicola]|nr:hypothetical protein [Klebsiella variicola]
MNRGSVTFWLDVDAIHARYELATTASRGQLQRYSKFGLKFTAILPGLLQLRRQVFASASFR